MQYQEGTDRAKLPGSLSGLLTQNEQTSIETSAMFSLL